MGISWREVNPVVGHFTIDYQFGVFSLTQRLPAVICVGLETVKTTFIHRLFIAPEIGGMKWEITRICPRPKTDIRQNRPEENLAK